MLATEHRMTTLSVTLVSAGIGGIALQLRGIRIVVRSSMNSFD